MRAWRGVALAALALALAAPSAAEPKRRHDDGVPLGPSLDEQLAEIQRRVQEAAIYPAIAIARGVSGETEVAFTVDANGTPHEVHVFRSSGHVSLDRAAQRAVLEAGVLPLVHGHIAVPVHFVLEDELQR